MKCFSSGWILLVIFMGVAIFEITEAQTTDESGTTDDTGTGGTTGETGTEEPLEDYVEDSDNSAGEPPVTGEPTSGSAQLTIAMGMFVITSALTCYMF